MICFEIAQKLKFVVDELLDDFQFYKANYEIFANL